MVADQQRGKPNREPIEGDGLSALKRLAALDNAGSGASHPDRSSQTPDLAETIPDWLEMLLVKYGEQASELPGIQPDLSMGAPSIDLTDSAEKNQEALGVASLLEQMAAESETEASTDRLATSVDWGKPAPHADEETEDKTPDWLDQIAEPSEPSAEPLVTGEVPDWLSEIGETAPQIKVPVERSESPGLPADAEDVPDWLQELSASPQPSATPRQTEPSPPEIAPSESEVPDWLGDLRGPVREMDDMRAEETSPARQVAEPPPDLSEMERSEGELPAWLARLADIPPSEVKEVPAAKPLPPETPPIPPTEAAAEAASEPEEGIPDWLREVVYPDRELEAEKQVATFEPAAPEIPPELPPEIRARAPAELEEDMPDWLRELEAAEEVPIAKLSAPEMPPIPLRTALEAAAEPEEEIPGWLASLREETSSPLDKMAQEATPQEAYPDREAVAEPEWLAALRTTSEPELLELDEAVVEAEDEGLPDWLAALRASQTSVEIPRLVSEEPAVPIEVEVHEIAEEYQPPTQVEVEILEAEEGEPLALEAEPPEPVEVEPPELVEAVPPEPVEVGPPELVEGEHPEPVEGEYPAEEEAAVLDWLVEIEAAAAVAEYTEGEILPGKAEAPSVKEEIPDWLRQMPPADLVAEAEIHEIEKDTVETRRLPEWLVEEPVPGPGEEKEPEEALELEEAPAVAEAIEPAEVPDWLLKLKPEKTQPMELREREEAESEDVLAGIPGLLPIAEEEPEVEEEPIAALRSRFGVPAVPDVEGAQLFREIVTERPGVEGKEGIEARPTPEARRGRIVETLVWALIFIILIAGIALALLAVLNKVGDLLGGPAFREFFGSPLVIDPAPVNTFRAQVTRLPPDAVVVVSFDYSPATEAEMEPLASIISQDLLENQARVIAVSLRPEGAMMAQRLFERLEGEYPYGERTINLGYLPGQTAGVRSLAFLSSAPVFQNWGQTLEDYPAWQDVEGLDDIALVVAVADSPLAVRWWVEQMGPGTPPNRPMVAAVSAAADPSVRPYYDRNDPKSGQLLGLVSGITDAAAYENRLGRPERAVKSLAAQSVAHLGLVVIGLGGAVVGFRMHATE